MRHTARQTRENRTITVDFQNEATYFQLLGDGKAFVEFVCAFILSLGFQLAHKASCRDGGGLTRHSHYVRLRVRGITIWRIQCTTCKAVFTVLPHFVLRYRQIRPEVARDALLATHGGLSLELCAVLYHISPMALYRLVCALGQQSLVTVLTRCGLPLPVYFLADEKHSRCLTAKVYLPTIVCGRVLWHLGYTTEASAAAFTASYGEFQHAVSRQEPAYRVRGILTDGFDSTTSSLRTLFPGARLGFCLRHALLKLPKKLVALASPVRQSLRTQFHTLLYRMRQRKGLRVFALGQRLRHFADHVATTAGTANGERVRRWFRKLTIGRDQLPFFVHGHSPAITSVLWLARVKENPATYAMSLNGVGFNLTRDASLDNLCKGPSNPIALGTQFTLSTPNTGDLEDLIMIIQYTISS